MPSGPSPAWAWSSSRVLALNSNCFQRLWCQRCSGVWQAPPRACIIAADQQSTGTTGVAFTHSKDLELATQLFMDPPHRFWNNEKLGLLQGNGWAVIVLTTIPYSN
eukprot:3384011-Lingulodinium_polyedra.AAC.1